MFRNGFCKVLSVSSSVVVLASSVFSTSVSAEKFNWWLLFLYFFGVGTHSKDRDVALESKKGKISADIFNLEIKDPTDSRSLPFSSGNSLESSEVKGITSFNSIFQEAKEKEQEAKSVFSSVEKKLAALYKQKEKLEIEVEKEKNSGKKYWEYYSVKTNLINVCEEIGRIKAKVGFFRQCAKDSKVRFIKEYCEKTANYSYTLQMDTEQNILDNGVMAFPESEGYTKGFKNTDLLINVTWQLERCRLKLKFAKGEIDEKKIMDLRDRKDLISNSVPFSNIAVNVIDYFKDDSKQDARL